MRPLNPDEAQAWARVMASVRPLKGVVMPTPVQHRAPTPIGAGAAKPATLPPTSQPSRVAPRSAIPANTLDASWDRRLGRGVVFPDSSLDLHGHTLASAHALLDQGLERAIARGDRVLLLVTGKPPRAESERPYARGAIRAAIADWLAMSRHAGRIAAVRGAHPRHGGTGALYIVFRRERG